MSNKIEKENIEGFDTNHIMELEKAKKEDPKSYNIRFDLGNLLIKVGRYDEALKEFKKAVSINPKCIQAHVNIGAILLDRNQIDKAIDHFNEALKIDDTFFNAIASWGTALLRKNEFKEAILQFEKAGKINNQDFILYNNWGIALSYIGNKKEAIKKFLKSIELNPEYSEAHNNLGLLFEKIDKIDKAIHEFKEAFRIDHENYMAHFNLGRIYSREGDLDAAILEFKRGLNINPEYLPALVDLANALLQKEEFDELITKFENLKISDPGIEAYINNILGRAYGKKGLIKKAINKFELSISIDTKFLSQDIIIAIKKNYGLFLLENEKYTQALDVYRHIIELKPEDVIAHLNSGEVLFHMAKLDDSIGELEIALNLDPKNSEIRMKLEGVKNLKKDIYGANFNINEDVINGVQIGEKIGSDFRVYRIKKGGMGIVYICLAIEHGFIMALKTFQDKFIKSEEEKTNFIQEAYSWIKLERHPNIIRAGTVLKIEDKPFIVLEYIPPDENDRNTLDDYLKSENLSKSQILDWAIQFCYGMEYALSRGVAPHLDIKPENIMITRDDKLLKITDFGLAMISDEKFNTRDEKGYQGTDAWKAPEVFDGNAELRSDIYSFGIVLYQMVNEGKHPFNVNNPSEWEKIQKTQEIPYTKTNLFPIIKKCLEKYPEKRYHTFQQLRLDLEEIYKLEISDDIYKPSIEELKMDGHFFKGKAYRNLGFDDLAVSEYETAKEIESNSFLSNINLGSVYNEIDRPKDAIDLYIKAVEIEPDSPMAHYNLGNAYSYDGHIDKAILEYEKAIKLDPNYKECYVNYGNLLRGIGNFDQAIGHFKTALEIDPHFFKGLVNLGSALSDKGLHNDAIELFKDAEKIKNTNPILYNSWGNCLINKGDYKSAFSYFLKAIILNSKDVSAQIGLGLSFLGLNKFDNAIQKFKEIIEDNPDNYETFYFLGFAYQNKKNYTQAISNYDECIRINPNFVDAYYHKGNSLGMQGKHKEALECFNKALEINSEDTKILLNKGIALLESNNTDEALKTFDILIKDQKLSEAWFHKGRALANIAVTDIERKNAIKCIDKALEKETNLIHAILLKGSLLADLGEFKEALKCFDNILKINPKNIEALLTKRLVLEKQGKLEESKKILEEINIINPNYFNELSTWSNSLE